MGSNHIMVTGGAGMIGSNLVKALASKGHRVSVIDNLWRGKKDYLKDENGQFVIDMNNDFYEIDLSIPGQVDGLLGAVDYVYHLADVVAGVDYVFSNEGSIFRQNILINSNMITAVRANHSIKGFIYVGTACSFPADMQTGVDAPPLKEIDQYPADPESAYGWSKLMGEYEALLMEKETGIPVSVLIFHNVYGTPTDFDVERSQVIPSLARKLVNYPKEPFIVWGTGSQGRSFVHVNDVVNALLLTMEKGLGKGAIQIGSPVCSSIRNIAETLVEISGKNLEIQYDTSKPEGDRGRCADHSKATEILGWEPSVDLHSGLRDIYQWISEQCAKQS